MSLEHLVWDALTSGHAHLAEGDALAKRYPDAIAPFAATRDTSEAAWRSLEQLILPERDVALFTPEEVTPSGLVVTDRDRVDFMVAGDVGRPSALTFVDMTAAELPAKLKLVELTQPGPFRTRTIELGRYIGVFDPAASPGHVDDRQLIALAGERMNPRGYREISAVCVHPNHRGKGYAAELVRAISHIIVARGEVPVLHVRSNNASAIALYHKLGFTLAHTTNLAMVRRA